MTTPIPGASAPEQVLTPVSFRFNTLEVRTIDRDGQIWFVASDVARALGYAEAKDLTRWLDEEEKDRHSLPTPGGAQEVTILSESGLYHALLKSRRPEARPFRKWVTAEVLPAIRRSGGYGSPQPVVTSMNRARFLLSFDSLGNPQTRLLSQNAAIVDVESAADMATLMREYVPATLLPDLLRIGLDRLAHAASREDR